MVYRAKVAPASTKICLPEHGGDLQWAEKQFSIPVDQWVDLSTGISPWSWPVPDIPEQLWRNLPADNRALIRAAAAYYRCPEASICPVPGSQFAIANIPRMLEKSSVAIPQTGYREHGNAWQRHGHNVIFYSSIDDLQRLIETQKVCYAVVINPNNPSGEMVSSERLCRLADELEKSCNARAEKAQQSLLLIDEAFADIDPSCSSIEYRRDNCIILRSLGKFFGLAGLRLGFVLGDTEWCQRIAVEAGLWSIPSATQWIAEKALLDLSWCQSQQQRIQYASEAFVVTLSDMLGSCAPGSYTMVNRGLFITIFGDRDWCYKWFTRLAERGVLTRISGEQETLSWWRLGLPGPTINDFLARVDCVS